MDDVGLQLAIETDVVEKIVGVAVRGVDGVHGLAATKAGDRLSALADRIAGTEHQEIGVEVTLGKVEFAAVVHVVVRFGTDIPEMSRRLHAAVGHAVKQMTALELRELKVHVVDLHFANQGNVELR